MFVSLVSPGEAMGASALPTAGAASATDVRAFQSMMSAAPAEHGGLPAALGEYADSLSGKFAAWRNEWSSLGSKVDLNDHASAVHVIEQQAKLSSHSVEFQFALQSADSVRHAFKTLYQQQA